MKTMTWHLILYMLVLIIGFVWAIMGDDDGAYGISTRACRLILWIILTIVISLIYGGIFWW